MSGQPYKYHTDVNKYRTMYMEALNLQADINSLNLDANRTYKETGQLPAVSQMKDTRTTTEVLADFEKLKTDLVQTIAKISNSQFGLVVVDYIIKSPLNTDNKLLIFSAQRIDDIIKNLKGIYKYGIKGDDRDAIRFVNFIETMFNDKNALVAQTKSYMNRLGTKTMGASTPYASIYEILVKIGASAINWRDDFFNETGHPENEKLYYDDAYDTLYSNSFDMLGQISDVVQLLIKLTPKNPNLIPILERKILKQENEMYPHEFAQSELDELESESSEWSTISSSEPRSTSYSDSNFENNNDISLRDSDEYKSVSTVVNSTRKREIEEERKVMFKYLDFLNISLPNPNALISGFSPFQTFTRDWGKVEKLLLNYLDENPNVNLKTIPLYKTTLIALEKVHNSLQNMLSLLRPNNLWTLKELQKLAVDVRELMIKYDEEFRKIPSRMETKVTISNLPGIQNQIPSKRSEPIIDEIESSVGDSEFQDAQSYRFMTGRTQAEDKQIILDFRQELDEYRQQVEEQDGIVGDELRNVIETTQNEYIEAQNEYMRKYNVGSLGFGLGKKFKEIIMKSPPKRRGRPKGCGIVKPYKESVKAHTVSDKGIMETPRFVKFGKYLVNLHRLNNEDIFALKRPSGGNIVEIPSIKISKNLGGVIKKMISGGSLSYSDISKLSEPEKAYLHKISSKSNILDKFDIPAPSKDAVEKDIHQFEVMRGEIMAGNDNKDLIKKFKLHIMKLSKNGTLPKREVQEILEELLELGY